MADGLFDKTSEELETPKAKNSDSVASRVNTSVGGRETDGRDPKEDVIKFLGRRFRMDEARCKGSRLTTSLATDCTSSLELGSTASAVLTEPKNPHTLGDFNNLLKSRKG